MKAVTVAPASNVAVVMLAATTQAAPIPVAKGVEAH